MLNKVIEIWCWIVGHDTICLKRHTTTWDDKPRSTLSVHWCVRCKRTYNEQWDDK